MSQITVLLTSIFKTINLLNNLPVSMNMVNKNIQKVGVLGKNLSKSRKTILTKKLAMFKKSENYTN